MSIKKAKNTKRSKINNPGLKPNYNSKIRQEYLDYDYLDKLSPEDLKWLNSFSEEYLGTNFNHPGKKLFKSKAKKRELYNQNNARNRCLFSQTRAKGGLTMIGEDSISKYEKYDESIYFNEDDMIDYLDDVYLANVDRINCFILFLSLASLDFQKL